MSQKILVVDDDPAVANMIRLGLLGDDYEVLAADNGRTGLERCVAEHPDLVVLDVMMPEMDGFEVLKRLKAKPATAGIPLVMLTAQDDYSDVVRGQQQGVNFYCIKPFMPNELTTLLKRILKLQPSQSRRLETQRH